MVFSTQSCRRYHSLPLSQLSPNSVVVCDLCWACFLVPLSSYWWLSVRLHIMCWSYCSLALSHPYCPAYQCVFSCYIVLIAVAQVMLQHTVQASVITYSGDYTINPHWMCALLIWTMYGLCHVYIRDVAVGMAIECTDLYVSGWGKSMIWYDMDGWMEKSLSITGPLWGESTSPSLVVTRHKGPVIWNFDFCFGVRLNKLLNK